jgi:D-xylose transport system substrate-binding protein
VNVKSAATLADQATKQGTKVISYNYMIQDTTNLAYWVARSNVAVGRMTAQRAVKAKPKGNYVLVGGDPGTDVAQDKTKGYVDVLQPHVKKGTIKIVSKQFNNAWDPALGQRQIENALTSTNNNIAAILCNYDGFCLSALQALKGTGLTGKVWIGGEDVFPEGANAIVAGKMAMSAYTDLLEMARLTAQAAHDLGNGRRPATNASVNNGAGNIRGYRVNSFAVTKQNMCVFIKETKWITYAQAYGNKKPVC